MQGLLGTHPWLSSHFLRTPLYCDGKYTHFWWTDSPLSCHHKPKRIENHWAMGVVAMPNGEVGLRGRTTPPALTRCTPGCTTGMVENLNATTSSLCHLSAPLCASLLHHLPPWSSGSGARPWSDQLSPGGRAVTVCMWFKRHTTASCRKNCLGPLLLQRDYRHGRYLEFHAPASTAVYWLAMMSNTLVYDLGGVLLYLFMAKTKNKVVLI